MILGKSYQLFSGATSIAVLMTTSTVEDTVNWLIRTFFALTIAIIAFFLKRVIDQWGDDRKALLAVTKQAARHDLLVRIMIEHVGTIVDARKTGPGRRESDIIMGNLLTILRGVMEDHDVGNLAG